MRSSVFRIAATLVALPLMAASMAATAPMAADLDWQYHAARHRHHYWHSGGEGWPVFTRHWGRDGGGGVPCYSVYGGYDYFCNRYTMNFDQFGGYLGVGESPH
jgi:hypothetical protein